MTPAIRSNVLSKSAKETLLSLILYIFRFNICNNCTSALLSPANNSLIDISKLLHKGSYKEASGRQIPFSDFYFIHNLSPLLNIIYFQQKPHHPLKVEFLQKNTPHRGGYAGYGEICDYLSAFQNPWRLQYS